MLVTLILCFGALLLIPTKAHVCPISVLPIMMRPLDVRGGSEGNQSRKKMKKKKPTSKKVIAEAMKEKDAAQALGDAIRERADILRAENPFLDNPLLQKVHQSVSSVGWAMGTSDTVKQDANDNDDGGGVEASKSSVLANYFLNSHGGAHALQSLCSLLAVLASVGSMVFHTHRLVLMKRAMMLAMTKHLSGVLAATTAAAKAIPEVGLRKAKVWMEEVALDPVSQYVFYTALMLLWLPSSASSTNTLWWWNKVPTFCFVGPILLREFISMAFVVSDILVLSSSTSDSPLSGILRLTQSTVNAMLSLLVTPTIWRQATASERQAILAKLTSRISLVLEVLVGVVLVMDGMVSIWEFSIHSPRPPLLLVLKRCMCARLYVNFLWARRKKITKLASTIRGGASEFPLFVMDLLLHPAASMGLDLTPPSTKGDCSWKDYAVMALDLDD